MLYIYYLEMAQNWFFSYKISAYKKIDGWLLPSEAICLYRTARKLKKGSTIVEIGSWKGKSTYCLARGQRAGRVIAIDPFDASGEPGSQDIYQQMRTVDLFKTFKETMSLLGIADKVDARKGISSDFIDIVKQIDLLFIDGNHSIEGCRFDYENYAKYIIKGGYLLFHDYQPARKDLGPTWVIDNLVIPSGLFRQVEIANSVWVGRRI